MRIDMENVLFSDLELDSLIAANGTMLGANCTNEAALKSNNNAVSTKYLHKILSVNKYHLVSIKYT